MTDEPLDLRLAPSALAAWSLTALGVGWSVGRSVTGAVLLLVVGAVVLRWRRGAAAARPARYVAAAALVVGSGALGVAGLRAGAVAAGPVPELARSGAQVTVSGVVSSDPVEREGTFSAYVVLRMRADRVFGRGLASAVTSPLVVIADPSWLRLRLGDRIVATGRLGLSEDPSLSAVLSGDRDPTVTAAAGPLYGAVSTVREGVREAASPLPTSQRALIPALVDGDDAAMPDDVTADFQTAGLTHLLAVSGTNLTLVLAFALLVARWCGITGRGLTVVGLLAVIFFILLARPEPSVLRAAAMGVVALAGLSAGGRRRGLRTLCVAVVVLVLLDPWLARSVGFLLSTLATGAIVLVAPGWRDALAGWLPRPLAEAIAVPLAAQVVCTPAVAAVSGQVSLIAVLCNLLVAPAVGPATVLGLGAGAAAVASDAIGHLLDRVAGIPAWWIVTVAHRGADVSGASVGWPVGAAALSALTLLCLIVVVTLTAVLRRRGVSVLLAGALLALMVFPVRRLGWPPDDWLMVMCDVGQGDAMVLNAGGGVGVVVDAGPEPAAVDDCLERLEVDAVSVVVLTHFHADHVDGLPGVLAGRRVGEIEVSPLAIPPDRAATVAGWAADAGIPVTAAVAGERRTVGQLSWQVLAPLPPDPATGQGSSEADGPNNASIVLRVVVAGHSLLLSGDAEPQEEDDILGVGADLAVDVYKVAHHGSANQDPDFVLQTHAPVALISVGADNDYGHPAPQTLALLEQLGARIYRTDLDGDIAVVELAGQLAVVTSDG